MSLFRKIPGGGRGTGVARARSWDQLPTRMRDDMPPHVLEGGASLEVVGESFYQENLWRLAGGRRNPEERVRVPVLAVLVPEADNPYDPNSVAVWVNGLQVGYLSRDNARRYRPGLLALQRKHGPLIALRGVIVGGGMRADGPGQLGVFLNHDPADFELEPPSVPLRVMHMRTGLSEAFAANSAGDTHHLEWMRDLPADNVRAVVTLRQLLARETDPLSRHFMHVQLETLLYRSRDAFASALDEYDEACRCHDMEMDGIRQACITEWGKVPVLETYRQMVIRQQKAERFEHALWWAERGIAVYGNDAARPEAAQRRSKTCGAGRRRTGRDSRLAFSIPMPHQRSATPRMKPWPAWPAGEPSTGLVCEAGNGCGAQSVSAPAARTPPNDTSSDPL